MVGHLPILVGREGSTATGTAVLVEQASLEKRSFQRLIAWWEMNLVVLPEMGQQFASSAVRSLHVLRLPARPPFVEVSWLGRDVV